MEILFVGTFTTSSTRFTKFDSQRVILFQIKVFGRIIKQTTLARYLIKVTVRPSFTQLRVIRRINRIPLNVKISFENSVLSPSYLNLLAEFENFTKDFELNYLEYIINKS